MQLPHSGGTLVGVSSKQGQAGYEARNRTPPNPPRPLPQNLVTPRSNGSNPGTPSNNSIQSLKGMINRTVREGAAGAGSQSALYCACRTPIRPCLSGPGVPSRCCPPHHLLPTLCCCRPPPPPLCRATAPRWRLRCAQLCVQPTSCVAQGTGRIGLPPVLQAVLAAAQQLPHCAGTPTTTAPLRHPPPANPPPPPRGASGQGCRDRGPRCRGGEDP